MSKIALEGNASGTGTFTIAAPNSNTSYTLTLPTATGTIITTAGGAAISGTTGAFTTTVGVGGATPAASGAGITFPATASASSDANTLDDYEEGTWTATVTTANNNATFTSGQTATGRYTKIGRVITFHVFVLPNVSNVGTGALRITGLPFTNSGSYVAITNVHDTLSASTGQGYVYDSGTIMSFLNANSVTELPISGTGQKYAMVAGLYFAT